jgi:hypothetical protein
MLTLPSAAHGNMKSVVEKPRVVIFLCQGVVGEVCFANLAEHETNPDR